MKKDHQNPREPLASFFFFFLLLAYPLISFLWRRSYPFFTLEVACLFLAALLLSALFTGAHLKTSGAIAAALSSLLITLAFMVQFNIRLEGILICLAVCLALAALLKTKLHTYGMPVLIALILGALLDGAQFGGRSQPAGDTGGPDLVRAPVVHILLDAFSGIEGLPPYPASDLMRAELDGFFEEYGFEVFTRAYSRYSQTGDSLYSAMNFRNNGSSKYGLELSNRSSHVLDSNALFDSLEHAGYRINVYQTGHVNLCTSNPGAMDKCWTYDHPYLKSIRSMPGLEPRIRVLAAVLLKQSTLLADFFSSAGWFVDMGVANHDPEVFANLTGDILEKADSRYFFAHVLLPHSPFAYLSDCSISYAADRVIRYPGHMAEPALDPVIYELRTAMYLEQMECALNSLRLVFDEMKNAGLFEKSIIVLHGDHGSLIGEHAASHRNIGRLSPADFRANFSTLFAIKTPFGAYRTHGETLSLSVLLEELSRTVAGHVNAGGMASQGFEIATTDPTKLGKYVYLSGTYPLYRVDVDIFAE